MYFSPEVCSGVGPGIRVGGGPVAPDPAPKLPKLVHFCIHGGELGVELTWLDFKKTGIGK